MMFSLQAPYGLQNKVRNSFLLLCFTFAFAEVDPALGGLTLGIPVYSGQGDNAVTFRLLYDGKVNAAASHWALGSDVWSSNYSLVAETGDVDAYPNGDLSLLVFKGGPTAGYISPNPKYASGGPYFFYEAPEANQESFDSWMRRKLVPRIRISSPVGQIASFRLEDGIYVSESIFAGVLTSDGTRYYYSDSNRVVYVFEKASGRLLEIRSRNGAAQVLQYRSDGLLASVSDAYSRSLTFGYSSVAPGVNTLTSVQFPGSRTLAITYHTLASDGLARGPIKRIDFPDGTALDFQYDASTQLLNKIVNGVGLAQGAWSYDTQNRVATFSGAGGLNSYSLEYGLTPSDLDKSYGAEFNTKVTASVRLSLESSPVSTSWTYVFARGNGKWVPLSVNKENGPFFGERAGSFSRDSFGNVLLGGHKEDLKTASENGLVVQSGGVEFNLPVAIAYADPTMTKPELFKKVSTLTHGRTDLPNSLKRIETYEYDEKGNVKSVSEKDSVTGKTKVTTYTRDALGYVLTIKGPNTLQDDTRTYTYDAQHNLASYTNALGYKTLYSDYDAEGRVGKVTAPNGLVTTYSYDPITRRLMSQSTAGQIYSFTYDNQGRLYTRTSPDGTVMTNIWDANGQLAEVQDSAGNKYRVDYNEQGKTLREQYIAP